LTGKGQTASLAQRLPHIIKAWREPGETVVSKHDGIPSFWFLSPWVGSQMMHDRRSEPEISSSDSHPTSISPLNADIVSASGSSERDLPATIGTYRILGFIGEGSMGIVYRAEQQNPQRIVALKVIRVGIASAEHLRRFERESELLGRLQHPGITRIYEAGTVNWGGGEQPYFAMEFIDGLPLDASMPDRGSRYYLELMAKICDAVNHAHQRGIIHRDLKPTNILVDETGQPKILDFGVAHVADSDAQITRQTDMGQLIGTIAYMSPEQVLADPLALDVRSDVYALGIILYELLARKAPYDIKRKTLPEVVRIIREQDPAPLSSVNRRYRGDVETIVAKALEKDKERRYLSAADLAADIRRYLADEPILARPASAGYRFQKFLRRNKTLVASTAVVFLILVAGIIVSSREAFQARKAEVISQKEAASANAVIDFLRNDLLAQASPKNQSKGVSLDPNITVRTALDRAAARIDRKFDGQPEVEAAIRDAMGKTYEDLAQYAESEKQLERALDLERKVWGPESARTLNTLNHLGRTLWHEGKYKEAGALFGPALEIERRVLGPEHPDTLYCMNNLANVYRAEDDNGKAQPLYEETLKIRRRVLGPENPQTLISINNLANVYWTEGDYQKAQALYTEAMETQRRVLGPEHPDTLLSMGNLASTYAKEGKDEQAEALFDQTLEVSRRVLGPQHTTTLGFLADRALLYLQEGKRELAEADATQVLTGRRRAGGSEDPSDVHLAAADLALILISEGKFAESEPIARENLEFNVKEQPDRWQRFRAESLLGAALAGEKKYAEAEPLLLAGYQGMLSRKEKMGVPNLYHLDRAREWLGELDKSRSNSVRAR
jgi:serine/threonine protein kinase/Tfp pilus assembly protein PilF